MLSLLSQNASNTRKINAMENQNELKKKKRAMLLRQVPDDIYAQLLAKRSQMCEQQGRARIALEEALYKLLREKRR